MPAQLSPHTLVFKCRLATIMPCSPVIGCFPTASNCPQWGCLLCFWVCKTKKCYSFGEQTYLCVVASLLKGHNARLLFICFIIVWHITITPHPHDRGSVPLTLGLRVIKWNTLLLSLHDSLIWEDGCNKAVKRLFQIPAVCLNHADTQRTLISEQHGM